MIVVAWTIVVASMLDPLFADSRGLAAGGPVTNNLAFGLFYVGVGLVMIVMAVVAWKSLFGRDADGAPPAANRESA
jgi:hypothetical protein